MLLREVAEAGIYQPTLCFCVSKTWRVNKGVSERACVDRSGISRSAHKRARMDKTSLQCALISLVVMGSYTPISMHCVHVWLQHNTSSSVQHLLVSPHYTAPCLTTEKICLVLSSLPRYLALVIQDSASTDLVNHFDKHCISSVA